MKKLFGKIDLTLPKVIIAAVIIGVSVGLLNCVPQLSNTTVTDVATFFDFWILCGIFLIMNSKSNKDAALNCFIFFLVSQPLIYLVEVPFKSLGWGLFVYYKYWFIWTLLTIPMGYIGYYMKKNKWYGLIILLPMLFILGRDVNVTLSSFMYSFPHHIINLVFILSSLIIYPLVLFDNKYLNYIGLAISIVLIIFYGSIPFIKRPAYETTLRCSGEELFFDDSYKAYLENSEYGDLFIEYNSNLQDYCINSKFYKPGDTKIIVESPSGDKKEIVIHIGVNTYNIED